MVIVLAIVTAVLLFAAVGFGTASLRRWWIRAPRGIPVPRVVAHISLQLAATGLWIGFTATGRLWIGWLAFAVVTVGQVFGDLLMLASHRSRHPEAGRIRYGTLAADVLGFSRPAAALHAIVGALGFFLMLVTCIIAGAIG